MCYHELAKERCRHGLIPIMRWGLTKVISPTTTPTVIFDDLVARRGILTQHQVAGTLPRFIPS
jgi:hypothetical protein